MKNVFFILSFAVLFFRCNPASEKKENVDTENESSTSIATESNTSTPETETPKESNTVLFEEFDWSVIPVSSAAIGAFPYITAPESFAILSEGHNKVSETGYSELKDFSKLIIYNGKTFYNAEGKVAELYIRMKDENTNFNQYKFDRSVEKYLESIGAKVIYKGRLTGEQLDELKKEDDNAVYNFITGDPYNEPMRFYALNNKIGKIMFQVFSNSASGEIGVVELEKFEQTIKAPTAMQMKKDIDATGKAILNINFGTDKATLEPDGQKVVNEILSLLKGNAALSISIEGHTDNTGTNERNKKLSGERANTVLTFLTSNGIDAQRLKATGYGAEKPLVANDTEENKAKNRRVELVKM